jgi:hypothetical protein
MPTEGDPARTSPPEPDFGGGGVEFGGPEDQFGTADFDDDETLHPINWNLLSAEEALVEWLDLDAWVNWLRKTFGLPPAIVPPLWHRHDELILELSALHLYYLHAFDRQGPASGPIAFMREFAESRNRLREWVSIAGCRIDRDRPTRQTAWPGEPAIEPAPEVEIVDRHADFVDFVMQDLDARRRIENQVRAS